MTTDHAIEVKKDGLRQVQSGEWKLSLTLHPNDVPTALLTAPMGTRYGMALVEIADDETRTPVADKPARKPATTRAEKARRLCGVPEFQNYLFVRFSGLPKEITAYETASNCIKHHCGVQSKSDLDLDVRAAVRWDELLTDYEQSTGRMAEKH